MASHLDNSHLAKPSIKQVKLLQDQMSNLPTISTTDNTHWPVPHGRLVATSKRAGDIFMTSNLIQKATLIITLQ